MYCYSIDLDPALLHSCDSKVSACRLADGNCDSLDVDDSRSADSSLRCALRFLYSSNSGIAALVRKVEVWCEPQFFGRI